MTSSLQKIVESKRALRHELASRPVAEKLRMLDAMRERDIAIRVAKIIPECESAHGSQSEGPWL